MQPRVERTRRVLELLDDPQRTYRVVHVTGTNGKTSTSRIIESLLRAHGLRTGLFTSPHLERFTERIMIDGEPIADAAVADAWDEIAPFVDLVDAELAAAGDAPLTFFELLTVLAFVAFADAPIDVLVLEVGMGGCVGFDQHRRRRRRGVRADRHRPRRPARRDDRRDRRP